MTCLSLAGMPSQPGQARSRWWVAVPALVLVILGGCTLVRPAAEPPLDWAVRDDRVAALLDWQARGRLAVKSARGGGQGDMLWRQTADAARIRVSGPFGAGAYEIRWDPRTVSVTSRNGESVREWRGATAAETFLGEQLGWPFPAASTRWWLLGLADPASPALREFTAQGELMRLEQLGWTISYERYAPTAGLLMPARLTLESGEARLRVVIDRWCLEPGCLDGPAAAAQ